MKALPARYAAWCRRQATTQCNPVAAGLGIVIVVCAVAGIQVNHELTAHWTGIMQAVAGTGAALACLAAAALVAGAMRLVDATPVPLPHPVPGQPAGRQPLTVTGLRLRPEDRDAMTREADMLASGELDFVVTERSGLFELREDDPELSGGGQ